MKNKDKLKLFLNQNSIFLDTEYSSVSRPFLLDVKLATLDSTGLSLISKEIISILKTLPNFPYLLGGFSLHACPMITAVMMECLRIYKHPIKGVIVDSLDDLNFLYNEPSPGLEIVVLHDLLVSGAYIEKACEALSEIGLKIKCIIVLVDKSVGGKKYLEDKYNVKVHAIFNIDDLDILGDL